MNRQKPRAVSYNRVSTEEEKQLNALAKQIQENREVISQMGWEPAGEYIDSGKSGIQTRKREAYNQLCQDLEKDIYDIIVIKDQDRLMRNPRDWYLFVDKLLQNGKKLYIHLDHTYYNPDNALLSGIKALLAEEYSRHLSRKINNAHKNRQEKGGTVILTGQTWGYRKMPDGRVQIDEQERPLIELIFKRYAQGTGSRLICRELANQGIRNRKGNILAESQIRAIVRNPLYKGTAVMNKTHINFDTRQKEKIPPAEWKYHPNKVPPIVSEELWQAANRTIDANKKKLGGRYIGQKKGTHFLSGKVCCGECGHKFWRNQRNLKANSHENIRENFCENVKGSLREKAALQSAHTKKAVYWYCSQSYRCGKKEAATENGCSSLRLKEEELYDLLREIGKSVFVPQSQDILLKNILDKICRILETDHTVLEISTLKTEQDKLLKKKERLLDLLVDGILPKGDYRKRLNEITVQMNRIKEAESRCTKADFVYADIETKLLTGQALDLNIPVLASHIDQIKVYAARIEIYFDFPDFPRPFTVFPERKQH